MMINSCLKRVEVTVFQELLFVPGPAVPYRAYRMDNIFAGQLIRAGDFCLTSIAPVEFSALFQKIRSGGAVDSTVYAAPAEQ